MGLLSRLFNKTETKVYAPYNSTNHAIDRITTLEDCKSFSKIIDEVNPKQDVQALRDKLCDKTVKIFLKKYGRK
jgi:hypothetical protein